MMIRILVVDDEPDSTALLVRRLQKVGYGVVGLTDSSQVLKILGHQKFDLILLDIMMPAIDGFQIAKQLAQDPHHQEIPIIFLSAKDSVDSKVHGLSLGAVDYITKPFEFKELQARIQVALQKSKQINYMVQKSKDLEEKANKDFLTAIFNRRYIDQLLNRLLEDSSQNIISLLMMDIDFFKGVNDTYGHDQGDIVLKEVAQIIQNSIRSSEFCGRYGGEEFIAVLPNIRAEEALLIAERIRKRVEESSFLLAGDRVKITISIGTATLDKAQGGSRSVEEWVRSADQALYRAKKGGRNQVVQG